MDTWDCLIIGAGPAGLSAALMLGRARRRILVVDAGSPRNRFASHMHGVLGREGMPPGELSARGRAEASAYGVAFVDGEVTALEDADDCLVAQLGDGSTHTSRAVILATGITDDLPAIAGLAERWGTTVLHCPYCHGWEVRDERLGVILTSPAGLHQAELVRQWSDRVTVFTNGVATDASVRERLRARGVVVVDGVVTAVIGTTPAIEAVRTEDGAETAVDAIFTAGAPRLHDGAVAGLALAREEGPMGSLLAVDAIGRTGHDRIWAVGNVVQPFANVPLSMGQGSMTGAAVNAALVGWEFDDAVAAGSAEDPATHWEARYADADRVWSGRPNATTAAVVAGLVPGTAIDLGSGEGGDAVWLAARGWTVTGVDISATAARRAHAAAETAGVADRAEFVASDLATWEPPAPVDLVTASFLHSHVDLPRGEILRRATTWVRPGGHLLVVAHAAPPPWADPEHAAHADLPRPEEDLAVLDLHPNTWDVLLVETRSRTATAPTGEEAQLEDGVVLVRRRVS